MRHLSASALLAECKRVFHAPDGNRLGLSLCYHIVLNAANSNFGPNPRPQVIKRMTVAEAMALTKARYRKTLDYLA